MTKSIYHNDPGTILEHAEYIDPAAHVLAMALNDIDDVSVASPTDGDFFYYDAATGLWKPKAHADLTTGVHGFNKSCLAYNSVDQSTTSGVDLILSLDSEFWDTDSIHDLVTNNSRLTCKTAGRYMATVFARFYDNTVGYRFFNVLKNGTAYQAVPMAVDSVGRVGASFAVPVDLVVNDYLQLAVGQNSGGALSIYGGSGGDGVKFGMARIP